MTAEAASIPLLFFFFVWIFLAPFHITTSMGRPIAQLADLELNKPAIQLSVVIDWHSSRTPHNSLGVKGKSEDYVLVTGNSKGVNRRTTHTHDLTN